VTGEELFRRLGIAMLADGEPFAPAGRVFREWVAVPRPDRRRWRAMLAEAKAFAASLIVAVVLGCVFAVLGAGLIRFVSESIE
jgi:hypothetical protein